jgi:uncharacterized OB-fold protein
MNKICPKCNSNMLKGLILTPGGVVGARWQEESTISKLFNNLKKLPKIFAYKCEKCGFVENYVESE